MYDTTDKKMEWVRNHWFSLKTKGLLEVAIEKARKGDTTLENMEIQTIIDIEESFNLAYKLSKGGAN